MDPHKWELTYRCPSELMFQLIENSNTREKLIELIIERGFWDHDTIQTVRGHLRATGWYTGDSAITHVFEKIGSLNIPTFILNGEKDNWVDPECGRQINNLISSSTIKEFEGVSHWAFLEQPNEYANEIINFLCSAYETFKTLPIKYDYGH